MSLTVGLVPTERVCGSTVGDRTKNGRKSGWTIGWVPGARDRERAYLIPEFSIISSEES